MNEPSTRLPVALVPAIKPHLALLDLITSLSAHPDIAATVVVDDGNGDAFAELFARLAELPGVTVLRHYVKVGKGAALKTGLHWIGVNHTASVGVVTLEADGLHHPDDVAAVARALISKPKRLIMGCRAVPSGIALRSRIGNFVSRWMLRAIGGLRVSDTQSGLRGIPRVLFPNLLQLRTVGHDFELDMLLAAKHQGLTMLEIPVRVLGSSSHGTRFNPLRDSLRIYYVFLRFNLSSLSAFVVDYSLFALLHLAGASLAFSQFGARAVSSLFNYLVNRHFVFKADQARWRSLPLYYATVVLVAACSYGLILLMHETLGMSVYLAKLVADTGLYIASFAIQREFVFRRPADEEMTG